MLPKTPQYMYQCSYNGNMLRPIWRMTHIISVICRLMRVCMSVPSMWAFWLPIAIPCCDIKAKCVVRFLSSSDNQYHHSCLTTQYAVAMCPVRLSVCLSVSRSGIVSERFNESSKFVHIVAPSIYKKNMFRHSVGITINGGWIQVAYKNQSRCIFRKVKRATVSIERY